MTDLHANVASIETATLKLYPLEEPKQKAVEIDALYHDAYKPCRT